MVPGTYWVLKREVTLEEVVAAAILIVVIVIEILLFLGISNGLLIFPVWVPHQHLKVFMSKIDLVNLPSVVGSLQDCPQNPSLLDSCSVWSPLILNQS